MSSFEYLSVLVSIIVGLAITHLLSATARLIQLRGNVRPHATTFCWMTLLFLINIQVWWVAFDRRDSIEWAFHTFLLYLLIPIVVFLLSYLVLPQLDDRHEVDLRANFDGNRRWFFGLLTALPVISLVEEGVREGGVPMGVDAVARVIFLLAALIAGRIGNPRFHLWNAVIVLVFFWIYIATLFVQLR